MTTQMFFAGIPVVSLTVFVTPLLRLIELILGLTLKDLYRDEWHETFLYALSDNEAASNWISAFSVFQQMGPLQKESRSVTVFAEYRTTWRGHAYGRRILMGD